MVIIDKIPDNNKINSLIFDVDGTITRWKNVKEFFKKSLERLNVPYTDEALEGLIRAMSDRELHELITSEADEDIYSYLLDLYIPSLREHGVSGKDLKDVMFELEASETFINDDVAEEIEILSSKYKLYIYTNWFTNQAKKKLDRYNLTRYFENINSSENTCVKYSKVGFIWLLNRYGLDKDKTVHIGDSESDVVPSLNAGIRSIYIDYGIKSSDDITAEKMKLIHLADASITEFKDIRKVLTKSI